MPIGSISTRSSLPCAAQLGAQASKSGLAFAKGTAFAGLGLVAYLQQTRAQQAIDWSLDDDSEGQGVFVPGGHHIRSSTSDGFVILDGAEQQRYRLFGVLPVLTTAGAQVLTLLATLLVLVASGWRILSASRRRKAGKDIDWLSIIPEQLVRLAFLAQWEFQETVATFVGDIMALLTAPVGIGRNFAAQIAGRMPYASQNGTANGPSPANGGGRRRWHGRANVPNAATSGSSSTGSHYSGLYNTGNSCFLNSTLQNLAAVQGIQIFLEQIIAQAETWDVPTPVTDALYDIVTELNTPTNQHSAFIPRQLTDALSAMPQTRVGSFFYAHQQQDAHELLVLVTSALDDELNAIAMERTKAIQAQNVGLCAAIAPSLPRDRRSMKQSIANPFRSLVAQRTACLDCGYVEAVRHYPTDELSLTVPSRAGSAITLEACLANWSKIEIVDWICFHCSLVRTLNRLRGEANYLASTGGALSPSEERPTAASASAKKKSGAKRRKHREVKAKEEIISSIITSRYSEDEVDEAGILKEHDIKLDRTFSRGATKQVMLARTPQVLVMHINRSSYSASNFGASKNNATVVFDEYLDVAPIVTGGDLSVSGDAPISRGATPMRETGSFHGHDGYAQVGKLNGHGKGITNGTYTDAAGVKTKYRLCGIVVHYGGHSSGHYVAFRRRKGRSTTPADGVEDSRTAHALPDEWYRISDETVTRCSLRDVLYQNPFLLFYERMGDSTGATQWEIQSSTVSNATLPSGHSNGHVSSSLSETAKMNAAYGGTPPQLNRQGQNGAAVQPNAAPAGFEHLFKTPQERVRSLHNPRIIERWASTFVEASSEAAEYNSRTQPEGTQHTTNGIGNDGHTALKGADGVNGHNGFHSSVSASQS